MLHLLLSTVLVYIQTGHVEAGGLRPPELPAPPQIDKHLAPLARSLAKMEEPAPEPRAEEPALLKSL